MIIYKIENNKNGMVYIGQTTKTVAERVYQHMHSDSKIGKAMVKEGKDNFTVTVLDHATNRQELDELERYWIAFFNAQKNGYNTLIGGKPTKSEFKLLSKIPKTRRKKKRINEVPASNIPKWKTKQDELYQEYAACFGESQQVKALFDEKMTDSQIKVFKGEIKSFKRMRL